MESLKSARRWPLPDWMLPWPEEIALLAVAAVAALACWSTGTGFSINRVVLGYEPMFGANFILILVAARTVQVWRRNHPSASAWHNGLDLQSDVTLMRVTVFLFAYITVYTNIKTRIPVFNPAVHDYALHQFERTLLGGFDVVEAARGLRESPSVAHALDRMYRHDYIFMTLMALYLHLQSGPRHVRHLFTSMAVLYLAGITVSAVWPTWGPCFFVRDQYTWMKSMGIDCWGAQEGLLKSWQESVAAGAAHRELGTKSFTGIAAFPSLHVGHCMLLCGFAWHYERRMLLLMVPITLLTWLATLTFGWHYLSDGLGVIPLAAFAWAVSRRLVFGAEPVGLRDPMPGGGAEPSAE